VHFTVAALRARVEEVEEEMKGIKGERDQMKVQIEEMEKTEKEKTMGAKRRRSSSRYTPYRMVEIRDRSRDI
jgi:hypothetical protein